MHLPAEVCERFRELVCESVQWTVGINGVAQYRLRASLDGRRMEIHIDCGMAFSRERFSEVLIDAILEAIGQHPDMSAFWLYPNWDGPLKQPFWMRTLKAQDSVIEVQL